MLRIVFCLLSLFPAEGLARAAAGTLTGTISDSVTHQGLERATVSLGGLHKMTGSGGLYTLGGLTPGSAHLRVASEGYVSADIVVEIVDGLPLIRNVELEPFGRIVGGVYDKETGEPISRHLVLIDKAGNISAVSIATDSKGGFALPHIRAGDYQLDLDSTPEWVARFDVAAIPDRVSTRKSYGGIPYPFLVHVGAGEQRYVDLRLEERQSFSIAGSIGMVSGL
jgi:hypothetical protein